MLIATDAEVRGSYELFLVILRSIIGTDRGSLIDLCSNTAPLTRYLDFEHKTYVDVLPRELGDEQPKFVQCDVLGEHESLSRRYQVSVCLDGIEHLEKPDGFKLLARMNELSGKQVLFTPLDPWCMAPAGDSNPESHHSVWGPLDVPDYACLLMPAYHEALGIGAFFFWKCDNLEAEFRRVVSEVNASGMAAFLT